MPVDDVAPISVFLHPAEHGMGELLIGVSFHYLWLEVIGLQALPVQVGQLVDCSGSLAKRLLLGDPQEGYLAHSAFLSICVVQESRSLQRGHFLHILLEKELPDVLRAAANCFASIAQIKDCNNCNESCAHVLFNLMFLGLSGLTCRLGLLARTAASRW